PDALAKLGAYARPRRIVALVEVGSRAEPKIDRYEHQSRAMCDRDREGPKPQLRRSHSRQHSRMAPVDDPEDAEPDDQETGADPNLLLPLHNSDQQREGKDHHEHCQEMADR